MAIIQKLIILYVFITLSSPFFARVVQAEDKGPQAVIFMYHRFGESPHPSTNVTLEQFDEQLNFFESNDFKILSLDEIVEALMQNKPLPDKAVAITIDDAYLSVYEEAYPRLKAKGYPFTVFVASEGVDQKIPAYMTWEQMREMQKNGVQFANHSQRHDYLTQKVPGESQQAWLDRMYADINAAQKRLQDELGQAPALFAYPYGEYNLDLMKIIEELGYTAFGQHSGGVGSLSDRRCLPRFPVSEAYAEMKAFCTKAFSLAMPVVQKNPIEPVTSKKRPPLTISLSPSTANLDQLACYIGDKRMKIQWKEPKKQFTIQTEKDLPQGRSRYNCTAPTTEGDRYYWFSHQWFRL